MHISPGGQLQVNLSNARISYEMHRDDGALCVYFKDKEEAIFFAEAILQELKNIENDALLVSDCPLIAIHFGEEGQQKRLEAFDSQNHDVIISVPDRGLNACESP